MPKAKENNKEKIIELVKELNVMELAELVNDLEEEFGVSAAAPVAAAPAGGEEKKEEEQTEFDVVLKAAGSKKIQVIKVVRQITKLGLKESKALVDEAPNPVVEDVSKEEAESVKEKIEAQGGEVEIK